MKGADGSSTCEDLVSPSISDSTTGSSVSVSSSSVESFSESELSNDVSDTSGSKVVACRPQPRRDDYLVVSVRNIFYQNVVPFFLTLDKF